MQGDIVYADGMRRRVKRRRLHAEAHNGHQMVVMDCLCETAILCLDAAAGNRILRQWQQIETGVKAVRPVRKRRFERREIRRLIRGQSRNLWQAVGKHPRAELLVERGKKRLRRGGRLLKIRRAERQNGGAQIVSVGVERSEKSGVLHIHSHTQHPAGAEDAVRPRTLFLSVFFSKFKRSSSYTRPDGVVRLYGAGCLLPQILRALAEKVKFFSICTKRYAVSYEYT